MRPSASRLRRSLTVLVCGGLLLAGCEDAEPDTLADPVPTPSPSAPGDDGRDPPDDPAAAPESDAPLLDYVALGDSLATGAGAATSYVEEFADLLRDRTGAEVAVTNFAVDGWTSTDLLASLQDDDGVRAAVADADVVTLDIGGNDLLRALPAYLSETCGGEHNLACVERAADEFASTWSDLLDELLTVRDGEADGIVTMDLYQPFGHDDRRGDDLDLLRPSLEAVNTTIVTEAEARGIPVAQVFRAFHGDGLDAPVDVGLISVDGLHPSNDGHRLIAAELLAVAYG